MVSGGIAISFLKMFSCLSVCVYLYIGMCICMRVLRDWVLLETELQAVGSHPVQEQYMILTAEPSLWLLSLNFLLAWQKFPLWWGTLAGHRESQRLPSPTCPFRITQHPISDRFSLSSRISGGNLHITVLFFSKACNLYEISPKYPSPQWSLASNSYLLSQSWILNWSLITVIRV